MLRLVALSLLLCSVAVAEDVKVQVLRDGKPAKGATVRVSTGKLVMLYAFRSDTLSHVWKLWVSSVASFAWYFVGISAIQPSMAS